MLSDARTENGSSPSGTGLCENTVPAGGKAGQTADQTVRAERFTLGKADKLRNKSDFDSVKNRGLRLNDSLFTLLAAPLSESEETTRCGIICSRKFHKRAVVRNRARRLLWEAFRHLKKRIPSCRIILIPRRKIYPGSAQVVLAHLEALLPELTGRLSRRSVSDSPRREYSSE